MLFLYSENESENSAEKFWLVDHDNFHKHPPLFADDESENYDGTRQNSHNKRLRTNHCDNHSKPESRKIIAESAAAPPASSHKNTTTAFFCNRQNRLLITYYGGFDFLLQLPVFNILDLVIHRHIAFVA